MRRTDVASCLTDFRTNPEAWKFKDALLKFSTDGSQCSKCEDAALQSAQPPWGYSLDSELDVLYATPSFQQAADFCRNGALMAIVRGNADGVAAGQGTAGVSGTWKVVGIVSAEILNNAGGQ